MLFGLCLSCHDVLEYLNAPYYHDVLYELHELTSIGLEVSSFLLAVGIELITSCLVMRLLPSSLVRAVRGEIEYVCIARMNIYVDHRPRGGKHLPRERSRRVEDQQDGSPVRGRDACM